MKSYSDDLQNTKDKSRLNFWWRVANTAMLVGIVIAQIVAYYAPHAT